MKTILNIGMDIMLWLFYYQTVINTFIKTDTEKIINYHNFAVNTVIFCVPYIFSGISSLADREKEAINKMTIILIGSFYMFLCIVIFSCITLEFILQNRTVEDLILGIPDLFIISKMTIENYAKMLIIFPIFNYLLKFMLKSSVVKKGVE